MNGYAFNFFPISLPLALLMYAIVYACLMRGLVVVCLRFSHMVCLAGGARAVQTKVFLMCVYGGGGGFGICATNQCSGLCVPFFF